MTVAHGLVSPGNVWESWSLEPAAFAAALVAAGLYARGAILLRTRAGGRAMPRRRIAAFGVGMLVLVAAWISPLHALGETLFSAHMGQHLLMIVVAPPLLVYGAPVRTIMAALPPSARGFIRRARRRDRLGWIKPAVTTPVLIWLAHVAVLWTWHLPALYQVAVRNPLAHALEHLLFLSSALLFWGVVIQNHRRRKPTYGAAAAFVFAAALQSAALGVVLLFAPNVLYPLYAAGAHTWGLTPLADQQLAGALMWVPAGVVYFVAVIVLFARWMRDVELRMRRREARLVARAGETAP